MNPLFVLFVWLPHHDVRNLFEVRQIESLQQLFTVRHDQVLLDLHYHVVPWHHLCNGIDCSAHAEVVHQRYSEVEIRLVIGMLPRVALWLPDAALDCPFLDLPIAELHVLRILVQETVKPVEGALVRKGHGKKHLILAILGHGRLHLLDVSLRSLLHHAALEGQGCHRLGPEVHLQRDVAEGNVREKGFPLQVVRQGLWFADALAIAEEAQRVCVGTLGI
mmetsp:Transcript_58751/g.188920  ORF Transcript_58751/g.188920 Transcript_58751/m.188920 type:complete len:220 (+) Transcript_58751:1656-2315(+)